MSISLDIILIILFALFIFLGVRRGFVRSAVHFLGSVIAAALSSALGGAAANWVYNTLFRDALIDRVSRSIESIGVGSTSTAIDGFLESLPDFIVRALESSGITAATLEGGLVGKTGEVAELVADSLAPVFTSFLKVLAVMVLFLLFMMIVRSVADLVGGVFRLPGFRQFDRIFGGLFGFLLALVAVWVILAAVQVFTPMLSPEMQAQIDTELARSVLAGTIVKLNPLTAMF